MGGYRNIPDFLHSCKVYLESGIEQWGLIVLMLLVGFASFGLGRLSALENVRPAVSIESAAAVSQPQGVYPGGQYVASKTGAVYYFPWCAGGEEIPPEKQVWFATAAAAQAAGYAPAKNCKGLE